MQSATMTREQIAARIRELGEWFHNMDLGGVKTAPHHFLGDYPQIEWQRFAHVVPEDLRGKTVLDIGCNAGFYAIEMKRRGADRVVGIDTDDAYLAQARFAAQVRQADIELRKMSVYEVDLLGEAFDLVIFVGVLHQLRHPLLALDLLHRHVVRGTLLFQSMLRGGSGVAPLDEGHPGRAARVFDAEGMLRSAGFDIVGHPEHELFVCRPRAAQLYAASPP
jgi:tRNA (mo5U34)-methyltransferase